MPSALQRRTLRFNRLDFFETPAETAEMMARSAYVHTLPPGAHSCDPTCGHGALLHAAHRVRGADDLDLFGIELDPNRVAEAQRQCISSVLHADIFDVQPPSESVDVILANPPFKLSRLDEAIGSLRTPRNAAITIIEHIWPWLAPDGMLVAIMPNGWQEERFHQDSTKRAFAKFVQEHGHYEELSAGLFKEAGTTVATTLIVLHSRLSRTAPYGDWPSWNAFQASRYLRAVPQELLDSPLSLQLACALAPFGMTNLLDQLKEADWQALRALHSPTLPTT